MADIRRKSPTYPRISLQRAIDLSRRVYDSALTSSLDTPMALNLMGFKGDSGPSRAALASLKQFGLIDGRDQALKVTPLAQSILQPMAEDEQRNAIVSAGDNPAIYQSLRSNFGGRLPSDAVLKAFLLRNHQFSGTGAELLVKVFRETENFTSPYRSRGSGDRSPLMQETASSDSSRVELPEMASAADLTSNSNSEATLTPRISASSRGDRYVFRISKSADAELILRGRVTSESLDKLAQYIQLMKEDFPSESEAEQ